MALDGCRGGLCGTQEASKGSSVPPVPKHKAEQLQSDPRLGVYASEDSNLPNSVPATVCYQQAPHVLSYAPQHDSSTVPDVGTFMGNAQSSSISDVTSYKPCPFQQGEDHSEVVSNYQRSYTARALSYPHPNSPCQFPDPFHIAAQQLQNDMGDASFQRELRTGSVSSGADLSYSHKRAAQNLLRSFQGSASTNFSAGVTEFACVPADVSKQPKIPSSPRGDPHEQPLLWLEDGTTATPRHKLGEDSAAESTQKPVTLNNTWETSFQLASEENCCLHLDDYNTSKRASVVECLGEGAGGSSNEVICLGPPLPTLAAGCTMEVAVEEKRCLQVTQPPAAFVGKGVELEYPSLQGRQRSNIKKRAKLLDVLPVASPFPPYGCAIPLDNEATQEDIGIFDLCWRTIQPGSEQCGSANQLQQPAGETDQRIQDAGQKRGMLDTTSVLTQRHMRGRLCCNISEGRSVGSSRKAWVPNTKIEQQETEKITAFIAALHSFLSSVDPFAEVKDQLTVADIAEAVSVSRHSDLRQSDQDLFAAESVELQVVSAGASRETPVLCSTHCTIAGADSLAHAAPTSDAALGALENKSSHLGPPSHAAGTCSQRTTYCSGVTAIGSGRSSYASAISVDRCASYSSCSSISGAGYNTSSTTMLLPSGNCEHKETENVASAVCNSLLEYSSSSPPKCLERVMAGMAPRQNDYALAAAAVGSPTTIPKYASERPAIEDSRFRSLVRAFYADNSRHSVLWDERQQRVPPFDSSAHGQLTAHRDCWMAAAGIMEVTHQVKELVNRLRGLELVTRELAAIPEPSGALCCCLSGHLVEHAVAAERTATGALARWKFEQLLVISVRDSDSTASVQLEHEFPALRSEEIPSDSLTAVHAFQIQDEVFVVSPVYGSHTSSTKAVTVMSPLKGAAEQRASDAPSEEHGDGVSSALLHVHSTSAEEGSYHCPIGHGLTAFLKWKGQYGLREWRSVSASGRTMSNVLRSSCEDTATARNTQNAGAAATTQNSRDSTSQVDTGHDTSDASSVHQATLQTASGENSSSSIQQHQMNRLRAENTVPEFDASVQESEMERNKRERIFELVELFDGGASPSPVTRQVESTTQLARVATTTYNEQLIDPPCAERLQLYPKQKVQNSADACLFSGGMQHDQSPASGRLKLGFESRSPLPTLPALATLQEAATACPKRLMNAFLQCVQDFEKQGQTSSSVSVETGPLAVSKFFDKITATNANFEPYSSSRPLENVCELQPPVPPSRLADIAAAGARDNAVAPAETIIKHHGLIEWRPDNSSGERLLPSGAGHISTDARDGLNSAKQGTQRRIWGDAGLDVGASRARAPRRRATRAEAKERNARVKSTPDVEDNLQSLGFFREHCTVFVSWVPRAARADDIKQKSSMETRLKLLLQVAMGVRGIVRVALFPPRGSHCCVLFESPAAASAFIQEYGGPTYTSTTEQFKADICAAYAVALDRGIERVFIRIEEFKPHVLQQPFLQQTRDRSTPAAREWHDRRRECATALHQPPSGRWRHQLVADGCRRSPNYITPGSSIQPSHSPLFPHDTHGKDAVNGWTSALPRLWRTHGQNLEPCSMQRPTFRQYLPQQLLEDQGHRRHHWNR